MSTHKKTNWNEIAEVLWEQGVALFPIDESLVDPAREGFTQFLKRRREKNDDVRWRVHRPGENEYDMGLIQRNGGQHDVKSFFHHDHSLNDRLLTAGLLTDEADTHFLMQNLALLKHVNEAGMLLTQALDALYGLNCADLYESCSRRSLPFATGTLRSLYYVDSPRQTGAKAHIDRSFLTIHLGDQGGSVQTLTTDGEWIDISPPQGFAIAFFGVKVLWVSKGQKGPLRHRSITIPGQDRFAFVHFGHVPLRFHYVRDAGESAEDFAVLFQPAMQFSLYHWR